MARRSFKQLASGQTCMKTNALFITRTWFLVCFAFVSFPYHGSFVYSQEKVLEEPTGSGAADSTEENSEADQEQEPKKKVPPGLKFYLGREIAQTMHFAGAPWLIRDSREREERCSMMLANLGLKNGMTVCDMGCGNGFHTLKIAEMLGDNEGSVFAVDVQPMMLKMLRERLEEQGIENVVPILGSYHSPRLPSNSIDLILLVDVYHEFSHPVEMLAAMKKSLKKDGAIVLVEFRAEDESVPIKPLHKMSKEQIDKEMTANGFALVKEFERLPWQHMMFYGREKPPISGSGDEVAGQE